MPDEIIRREFAVTLNRAGADLRTLGGCCVPYNRPTEVSDDGVTVYREMFAPGAFGKQLSYRQGAGIPLRYRHGAGLLDQVGKATQLDEDEDGLHGMFRVFSGHVGDQALTLVDEGVLGGLSVSGIPTKSTRAADGTVVRQRMHLTEISLCEEPAYADALVSVRRTRQPVDRPPRPADDQLDRLAAIGIVIVRSD